MFTTRTKIMAGIALAAAVATAVSVKKDLDTMCANCCCAGMDGDTLEAAAEAANDAVASVIEDAAQ